MSDDDPLEPEDPFSRLPFLGDFSSLFGGGGGAMGHDMARQMALGIATEGASEPNVDPSARIEIEQLARVAELQISEATGLRVTPAGGTLTIEGVNRTGWVDGSIDAYEPIVAPMSDALSAGMAPGDEVPDGDPMAAMMAGLFQMLGPLMSSMTTGSMVGQLARRSLGIYDLPVPRPLDDRLMVVVPNLDGFAADWSLPVSDLRLWVCLHEVAHHAVLGLPHVRERLLVLLRDHAAAFRPDPSAIEGQLGQVDLSAGPEGLAGLQDLLGDPDTVLGAVESEAQRELRPHLAATVAAVVGYVDHVMDLVGGRLIEHYGQLTEALRRRRVEADASDRFVERIFGLELTQDQYDRAGAFIDGIVERAGADAPARLWTDASTLPTPAEIDAPGLWLARIDLPLD